MGQTAIVSPQIIDSTSIGRDLITAADQAAAQAIIGVTGVDTGEDYTWTGDHTFDGSVTFTGTFDAVAGSFSGNLINEVGGSYKLYNLGTEGDADTEYLELSWAANKAYLKATETGNGTARDLVIDSGSSVRVAYGGNERILFTNTELRPVIDNYTSLGASTRRYSNTYSVDGDFSGVITAVNLKSSFSHPDPPRIYLDPAASLGYLYGINSTAALRWSHNAVLLYKTTQPASSGTVDLGTDALRFNKYYGVDGSFSGNLISETGGSYKLYNLGTEGDADTEYLEMAWDTNVATIRTASTGSGSIQDLHIMRGNNISLDIGLSNAEIYTDFRPAVNNNVSCGAVSKRWYSMYSVDGDFSGTVTVDQIQSSLGDEGIKFDANYGYLTASNGGANVLRWAGGTFEVYGDFDPRYDNISSLGSASRRWVGVNSVAGSFSGDLISEAGGSYKLYNLGTEGDADTEYLGLSWSGNVAKLQALQTGTGADRRLDIEASGIRFRESGTVIADIDASALRLYTGSIRPLTSGAASAGTSSIRFSGVYGVDGDFSGTMTLSNLPTSDPAVAGQLWNDSGTVKISAG